MASEEPADLLFVFAGAPWRKEFALRAWRAGAARTLVLSVGRFEWRRLPSLGLPDDGGLRALVDGTPPPRRHFFILLEGADAQARLVPKGKLGTWSEALALARLVVERRARSVAVCTSDYHLPRATLSVRRAFQGLGVTGVAITALPVAEPENAAMGTARRRRSPLAWALLLQEWFKGGLYALVARVGAKRDP